MHAASLQSERLDNLRRTIETSDLAAMVLFDPINIRYATGSRNMQVWTMHHHCRYLVVTADGPVILYDMPSASHLSAELETITEVRPSLSTDFMIVGDRNFEMANRWAAEIADVITTHGGGNRNLGVDRLDLLMTHAAQNARLKTYDAKDLVERARARKTPREIRELQRSLQTTEAAIAEMRDAIKPGMTEREALGILVGASIARGGEYPETRLLTSGPRTNPWFQETGFWEMSEGSLIAFDTDLIGPGGFYNDISRTWTVGETKPTDEQRRLYAIAHEQLRHNIDLLRPGMGFLEYSDKAYQLPDEFIDNRYADVAHGCGLDVEYPLIWYREDEEWGAYDGMLEENMVVCVECYVGATGGGEGVKLEEPVWITRDGPVVLSEYPLETDWL